MDGSQSPGEPVLVESGATVVLVGGPLAGREISVPALDQPMRIQDDDGVWQEYHPAPEITESVHGHVSKLPVFRHYMPVKDADEGAGDASAGERT